MPRSAKRPTNNKAPNAGQSAAAVVPARVQPVTVPTGQPYGEAKALADAQRQLPVPGPGGSPNGVVAGGGSAGAGGIDGALAAAQGHDFTPVGLGAPTQRPYEPITSGLSSGAGPGPEALQPVAPIPASLAQGAAVLNALGDKISPEARELRDLLNGTVHNQAAQ